MKGSGTYKSPKWHKFLWIPVCVCVVIAALFLFGVLPGGGEEEAPAPTPAAVAETPDALLSPSPGVTFTPAPTVTPALPEGTLLGKPANDPEISYSAALELVPSLNRFMGTMEVSYVNVTGEALTELVFHLHPNAYKTAESVASQADIRGYYAGFMRGETLISAVSINDEIAYFRLSDDELLLHVPFEMELQPGEGVSISITFYVDVPKVNSRFGLTQLGYQLGHFLPILAVYQDGGWMTDGYQLLGDPTYGEAADYRLAIRYPKEYTLVSTGTISSTKEKSGGTLESYVAAAKVRELSCMLVSGMQAAETTVNGVRLSSYALTAASAQLALDYAEQALVMMNDYAGYYPYETLSIVQAELENAAGVEFPGLIMISREYYLAGKNADLEMTIAHEVAHQWLYGIVGNDQINSPWLDEALTTYLGILIFDAPGSEALFEEYSTRYFEEYAALADAPIDGAVMDYASTMQYACAVYYRGGAMFRALHEMIGEDSFFSGLKLYVQQNAYRIATKADMIAAFEQASGEDLDPFFEEWLKAPPQPAAAEEAA